VEENTMNLSEHLCADKELFSGAYAKENTINLSEHLCADKELFSGAYVKENTLYAIFYSLERIYYNLLAY